MSMRVPRKRRGQVQHPVPTRRAKKGAYDGLVGGIGALVEESHRAVARSVNAILTATYWEIGRRIVEHEQQGAPCARNTGKSCSGGWPRT